MYQKYNEYELIYLYREQNEKALELLFEKYERLIKKLIRDKYISYEYDDCVQNMYIVLYDCIRLYDMDSNTPFINYLLVSFKHELFRDSKKEYSYINQISYNDDFLYNKKELVFNDHNPELLYKELEKCQDIEKKIVKEIMIEELSPQLFSKKYNIDLKKVYNITYRVKQKLRKSINLK
jgi:RNA polymerase sigma factor (sigma-70 family)